MIGFAGLSHLGIVSSLAAASKGLGPVVAFDPSDSLCRDLSQGKFPIYEKGLADLWRAHSGSIRFTSDASALSSCPVVYLSLDLATDDQNRCDLTRFHEVFARAVGEIRPNTVFIVMSQIQPGMMRSLVSSIGRMCHVPGIRLYYQVETLIFGNAVDRAIHPERFIIGCENPGEPLPESYAAVLGAYGCPIFRMKYESAELAKISINLCLASSLTVANTLAEICESIGADWSEIIPALKTDRRIGPYAYLVPGLGIGGGNIERDIAAVCDLAVTHGADGRAAESFLANSRHRKNWPMAMIERHVLSAGATRRAPAKIGIWGIAYKTDTASIKNSPSIELIRALSQLPAGQCDRPIKAYDPQARVSAAEAPDVIQTRSPRAACDGVDVLAIMTPWKEFSEIPPSEIRAWMAGGTVIDPFDTLDRTKCRYAGLRQIVLGAPPPTTDGGQ